MEAVVLAKEVLKKLPTAGWIPNFFWVEVETIVNLTVTHVIAVIVTVIAGAASVTTAEGVEAVVLEKEALKKLPTAGWNPNFSSEAEAGVAEAVEIWLTVTLVIAVRTVVKASVTSVAITTTETILIVTLVIVAPALLVITSVTSVTITTTTEITSIATLVIVAPTLVTVSATSVITITTTTEITSIVTLVIAALTLVIVSAASVITTITMAVLAVAVQPLTAIPAAVPTSAVKTSVTSVITIMMVGGRHLEQVEAGVSMLETLGAQMGVKIVPEAVVQSILMLEIHLFIEMCELFCLHIMYNKKCYFFMKLKPLIYTRGHIAARKMNLFTNKVE